jgi:putative heme degradation protein
MTDRTDRNDARPSFAGNPLVASVLRENVRIVDGRATIGLWGGWPALLADIPTFGSVLAISRNPYCVLGSVSEYPEIAAIPCGNRGCAVDGSLEFDFVCWQRAIAIVEARQGGWLYAVEFSDLGGEVIHKICLTEQSNFEAFRSWVELNQAVSSSSRSAGNPRHSSGLENSLVLSASGAEPLRTEVLRALFQMASAERWAFQAFVANDGAAQVAGMSPSAFCTDGHWIFAGDETTGMHVRVERLAEVFLHKVGEGLALKACDPEGHLVCAVAPPLDADSESWNARIQTLSREFSIGQP